MDLQQDDDYQLRKNTQAASILAGGGSPWQASMEAVSESALAGFFCFIFSLADYIESFKILMASMAASHPNESIQGHGRPNSKPEYR